MNEKESIVWYAIRTFHCKELQLQDYLRQQGLICFVPMTYETKTENGENTREMVPAVHNFVFVRKTKEEREMAKIFKECNIMMRVYTNEQQRYYEIPDREMNDIRLMCDPDFHGVEILDMEEMSAKASKNVLITQGPFKGLRGKLVRIQRQFFFVKVVVGIGIKIRISRWYCKVID